MRKFLFSILLVVFAFDSFAQNNFKKNDIYLELAGNGDAASLNFERQLGQQPGLGLRVGVGCYADNGFYWSLPFGVNYLVKLKTEKSLIDIGAGVTWLSNDANKFTDSGNPTGEGLLNFVPSVGYRRHTASNLMWRISFTPFINKYGFFPWLGISIGKRF